MSNDQRRQRRRVPIERPRTLPLHLTRRKPPIGFALLVGAAMTALAGGVLWGVQYLTEEPTLWPAYLFAGIFGLIGLLLVWSALRRLIASRVASIVIDLSEQPFRRGHSFSITLTQPGPASLRSIQAEIECLEQHFTWGQRRPRGRASRKPSSGAWWCAQPAWAQASGTSSTSGWASRGARHGENHALNPGEPPPRTIDQPVMASTSPWAGVP
jgi:hypothetical protein